MESGRDHKVAVEDGSGFINVWLRQADLVGRIGDVHPEDLEGFPLTFGQKREYMMQMMDQPNPLLAGIIQHPKNASVFKSLIGLPELYVPGSLSHDKQLEEIRQLSMEEAPTDEKQAPMMDETGTPMSTVPVQATDFHEIEAEVIRAFLSSDKGRDLMRQNPSGYTNVLAHYEQHVKFADEQAQADAASGRGPGGAPQESRSEA